MVTTSTTTPPPTLSPNISIHKRTPTDYFECCLKHAGKEHTANQKQESWQDGQLCKTSEQEVYPSAEVTDTTLECSP